MDLFDTAAAPSVPSAPPPATAARLDDFLPLRPIAWQKRLSRHPGGETHILVSALATSQVVECLSYGRDARVILYADGHERDIAPDPGRIGRTIYLTVDEGRALHAKLPMVSLSGGTRSVMLRVALPSEAIDGDPFRTIEFLAT